MMKFQNFELKNYLDEKVIQYNNLNFIDSDPIQIPHLFNDVKNIELSAFLTAIISWGQRKTIISNAHSLIKLMDLQPYDFVINASVSDMENLKNFKHRTFNGDDCMYFIN
ncbi:MAG: DUF2400 family protein [Bacteroidota bacterium]